MVRGYEPTPQVEQFIRSVSGPAPWRTLFDGLSFHVCLLAVCVAGSFLIEMVASDPMSNWWTGAFYLPLAVLCARQLRALELIVHDAAHRNFFREQGQWNDRIADLLFAAPVGQSVRQYRTTHLRHHRRFGTADDPCCARMLELSRIDPGPRPADMSWETWLIAKARFYWCYSSSYYRTVARDAAWGTFALWQIIMSVITMLIAWQLFEIRPLTWLIAWCLVWIVPLFLFLPIQRLLAERGEHDYEGGTDEFSSTIMNLGFVHRAILHPWNDSYHLLHHLHPAVPQSRHRWVHRELERIDPAYRAARRRWKVGTAASEVGSR